MLGMFWIFGDVGFLGSGSVVFYIGVPVCLILDKAGVCFQGPKVQRSWVSGVCWGGSCSHRLLFCTSSAQGVSQGSNLLRTHSSWKRGSGSLGVTGSQLALELVWGCGKTGG